MTVLTLPGGTVLAYKLLEGQSGHDAGRELLAALYASVTGKPLPPIRIAERGKPYFEDDPLYFSISHTRRHAFCALSREPIGIDAEELDRPIRPALAEKILSPGERIQYEAASQPQKALLTFWVLKEAAAKRSGMGLNGYPNHTSFSLEDSRVFPIDGCLVAVLTGGD